MSKKNAYFLSLLSGVLFANTWNSYAPAISLFIAFVPLFFIISKSKWHYREVFLFSLLTFLVFHLGTVWWLTKSSFFGALVIMLLNSMVMALVVAVVFRIRQILGSVLGIISLIVGWLSFEFLHYHWELSWPFMNLGNWLGQLPGWIQWYEYSGVLGGTFWILLANIFLYFLLNSILQNRKRKALLDSIVFITILLLPIFISKTIYKQLNFDGDKKSFLIVQPNIDPYKEKYDTTLFKSQINRQIELATNYKKGEYDYIIFPESSFPVYLNEDKLETDRFLQRIEDGLVRKNGTLVLGGFYSFEKEGEDTIYFNTAFFIEPGKKVQVYHKSKLVIGVEKMPYESYFPKLKKWNLNFGGYTNSLGVDKKRKVFGIGDENLKIASIICYESVYGQFVTEFVKNDAAFIAVITNDAWWGDTPGYRQHLMHSQLRAIETRRSVVRAANTGISCFINPAGEMISQLIPWKEGVLSEKIVSNKKMSFYTRNGDFIGIPAISALLFLIILALFKAYKPKNNEP